MRYQFVDEIVSIALDGVPRIEVAKRFAAGDDVFSGPHDVDRVPESMLLELMSMTGGHLVFRHLAERRLPLLLKVPECCFDGTAAAGQRLRAVATLRGVSAVADGTFIAETEAQVFHEAEKLAHARLMFVCVSVPEPPLGADGNGA